jgi:hypothetical protein
MRIYNFKTKKGWRKSITFQDDAITRGVNAFNNVVQTELGGETECVYVDVFHPLACNTKLCIVNENLMLETTKEKLLQEKLIYKEEF